MRFSQVTIEIRDENKEAVEFLATLAKELAVSGGKSAIVCYSPMQKEITTERICEQLESIDLNDALDVMVDTLLVDIPAVAITCPLADMIRSALKIEEFSVVYAYSPDNAQSIYRDHMVLIGDRDKVDETCDRLLKDHKSYAIRTKYTKIGDFPMGEAIKSLVTTNISLMLPYVISLGIESGDKHPCAKRMTEKFYAKGQS